VLNCRPDSDHACTKASRTQPCRRFASCRGYPCDGLDNDAAERLVATKQQWATGFSSVEEALAYVELSDAGRRCAARPRLGVAKLTRPDGNERDVRTREQGC
jgi:hypothetical protein